MANEIPEIELKIYKKINFSNTLLNIDLKYNKITEENYIILSDVKKIFKELGFNYKYNGENSHQIFFRNYKNYGFSINFIIKGNYTDPRYYILKDGVFISPKETSLYYLLNFIPFDEKLINHNFGFNSIEDLKNYIVDIIELCDKFTDEYIKEIEAENVPR